MDPLDLDDRGPLEPFMHGGKIPWHDPAFSARMLREHLSQEHEAASRHLDRIDRQVAWLHETFLAGGPGRVLDLGCGPGLYTARLARRGHACVGLDLGPASIAYARAEAGREGLDCTYRRADIRDGGYGGGYDLALLLFGEVNAFAREDLDLILAHAAASLAPGGRLVLEVERAASVEARGRAGPEWTHADAGLFSEAPYRCLMESAFFEDEHATVERFLVVDEATGAVTPYAVTTLAWGADELADRLGAAGFEDVERFDSLEGGRSPGQEMLFVLAARRITSRSGSPG